MNGNGFSIFFVHTHTQCRNQSYTFLLNVFCTASELRLTQLDYTTITNFQSSPDIS